MAFLELLFTNPLFISALIAGILASLAGGIVGSYVVVKRISFISGGISHSVLSGIGFCLWLERVHGVMWASPLLGALSSAVLSSLLIGWIHLYRREREDSVIAALWAIGMAIGVVFISITPGFNVELGNFLVGNILWVTQEDLMVLSVLDGVVIVTVLLLHKRFLAICFDEDQAFLQGQNVKLLYLILLILTGICVVLLIQVVGIILVMMMLAVPPAIANLFTNRLSSMMILASVISSLYCFFGMMAAFYLDWPVGATIALISGISYVAALIYSGKKI